MLNVSSKSISINERFFEALDMLKRKRLLFGIHGFSKKYDIAPWNLYTIKNQRQGAVKAEYLAFLVRDFGVSAHWLLTGEGDMFTQTTART